MNPHTATLDELRDWFADHDGFPRNTLADVMKDGIGKYEDHPIPATLDAAAAAMPEGWDWTRHDNEWNGYFHNDPSTRVTVYDTDDETLDRFRLAAACILADEERRKT
jgi:hypothetical protein